MAHQVFISYGHSDKYVADAACARLESRGIRCWIAPRDVLPGQPYGEALASAIRECRVLVLVFSSQANFSEHVSKEVERAVSNGIPVLPLRIENVAPTGALEFFIGSVHWLDALTPPIDRHLDVLADSVLRLIGERDFLKSSAPRPFAPPPNNEGRHSKEWYLRWPFVLCTLGAIALGMGIVLIPASSPPAQSRRSDTPIAGRPTEQKAASVTPADLPTPLPRRSASTAPSAPAKLVPPRSSEPAAEKEQTAANGLAGDWRGTLNFPQSTLRIILHVRGKDDDLYAYLDSLDQNSQGLEIDSILRSGNRFVFVMKRLGVDFNGTIENGRITGTFNQVGQPRVPLTLVRD